VDPFVEFENSGDLHGFCLTDAFYFLQFGEGQVGKLFKAVHRYQFVAGIDDVEVLRAGSQDQGKKLRRAERRCAVNEKAFSWPVFGIEIVNAHNGRLEL